MTDQIRNKAKYLFFFFFLIAIKSSAQTVSGIYSGTLVNDSLKMVQNYELALSEYRGKITGYSYITFVSNDTFYYGIKRIKATRQNGELIIEDVEMLSNNYPKRPDKGVHVINRILLPPGQDTIIDMNGKWETTATKKFYSISGPLSLRRNKDSSQSSLIAHLTELKEINYQDEKKNNLKNVAKTQVKQQPKEEPSSREIVSAETKPQRDIITSVAQKSTAAMEQPKPEQKPSQVIADDLTPKEVQPKQNVPQQTAIVESKPNKSDPTVIPTKNQIVAQANVAADPVASSEKRIIKERPVVTNSNNTGVQHKPVIANTVQKPTSEQSKTLSVAVPASKEPIQPAVEKQIISNNSDTRTKEPTPVLISSSAVPEQGKESNTKLAAEQPKKIMTENPTISSAPSVIAQRASNTIQTVTVASDSLILSFYDNGVVDGDSISVYLNNENIISSTKLKEAAVKKTIYINGRTDDIKLTLVADNLGSIPPNTGLLIIQDGNQRYQIRFSADLQTNASVILRKK